MKIRVQYGVDYSDMDIMSGSTVADLRRDHNLKANLGFSDNVKFLVHGIELPDDAPIPSGSTIVVETKANQKAELVS